MKNAAISENETITVSPKIDNHNEVCACVCACVRACVCVCVYMCVYASLL